VRTLKRNPVSDQTRIRARELRKHSTTAERKLWRVLRNYGTKIKFRRQHPIGPYIVDFYSPELALVIEVDGDTHASDETVRHDSEREDFLRSQGLRIKRYMNSEVMSNLDGVVADLCDLIHVSSR
jgi:crossover junction endodeoxyribonuclease RuvC/BirA family biotin operon repressor/biotin-[acetyl-CoA-carboxylase] ligase